MLSKIIAMLASRRFQSPTKQLPQEFPGFSQILGSENEPVELYNLANTLLEKEDFIEAVLKFTEAIERDPRAHLDYQDQLPVEFKDSPFNPSDNIYTSPKSLFNRASAYCSLDKLSEAIDDYTQAIRICPGFSNAYFNRSAVLLLLGSQRRSDGDLTGAEEVILQAKKDFEHCASSESLDLSMATHLLTIEIELGSLRHDLRLYDDACEHLRSAIALLRESCESMQQQSADKSQLAELWGDISQRVYRLVLKMNRAVSDPAVLRECTVCCINLGSVFNVLQLFDRAEELYRIAIRLLNRECLSEKSSENNEDLQQVAAVAHNYLGLLYLDTGRPERATKEFRTVVQIRTKFVGAPQATISNSVYLGGSLCNLGIAARDRWALAEAVEAFDQSISRLKLILSECSGVHDKLAEQFLHNAVSGRQQAILMQDWEPPPSTDEGFTIEIDNVAPDEQFPDDHDVEFPAQIVDAEEYFCKGAYEKSLHSLESWLCENPDSAAGWYWKARLERELGKVDCGLRSVDKALELDAEKTPSWYLKGLAHSETASSAWPNGELQKQGEAPSARLFHLDKAYLALDCFDEALLRLPDDYSTRLAKARILGRAAKATDARSQILSNIAEQNMGEEARHAWLSPVFQRLSCLIQRSRESYDEAIQIRLDDPEAYREKGRLLAEYISHSNGFQDEAIQAFEQAVELDSDNADDWYQLARLWDKTNDGAQARKCLKRSITLDRTLATAALGEFAWYGDDEN